GIESFNKSHLANAKKLKVLNINGNIDCSRLEESIFELTPAIMSISMRRIGFTSLTGLGLCGLCNLEFLEVGFSSFQTSEWIEQACGLGWPMLNYIGLVYVNLTYSTPTLSLMALSSENLYSTIAGTFNTNPITNNTCEMANFFSMIEGTPSWRNTPDCLPYAKERIAEMAPLRQKKYSARPCAPSTTDSALTILTLAPLIFIL
ncbi:hypothetical protein PFISCL1PPCAC_8310, partial [Pristionchus fissidentatus]